MTTTPLIVGGTLAIGATDFSDAITKSIVQGTADEIAIPSTLSTPKSSRKGGVKYELAFDYFSNDLSAELFSTLWDALTTGDGELDFTVQMREGEVSATNPSWSGTFVVLAAQLGGQSQGLSTGTATFPLIGVPVKAVV